MRDLLPSEVLQAVHRIHIRARRLVRDRVGGAYRSVFRGTGVEFRDLREYQHGDDVRFLDWNVTARMGQPYLKTFDEDREATVFFLVDLSGSGAVGLGPRTVRDTLAEVLAILGVSAVEAGDAVGAALFTDRIVRHVPPRKGLASLLTVLRDVIAFPDSGAGTDMKVALHHALTVLRPHSIVFLLGDLRDQGYESALAVAARKFDLTVIRVHDPVRPLCEVGSTVLVEDGESGLRRSVDARSPKVREALLRSEEAELREIRYTLAIRGLELVELSTESPVVEPLVQFFARREGRAVP